MSFFKYVKDHRFQLLGTFLTYFSMIIYACRSVSTPVALLDLQIQVQEPFSVTSRLVTAYSVGYFFGGFALGFIDGKCHNYLIQAATNILGGIFLSFVPSFTNIVMIFPLIGLSGFMNSLCETASNVVLIDLWGDKVCNYLQILYVAFGMGGLIAPIMIRPYQLPIPEECTEDPDRVLDYYKPEDVQIKYPYYYMLAMSLAIGISFILCYYFTIYRKERESQGQENEREKKEQASEHENGLELQQKSANESSSKEHSIIKKAVAVGWVAILGHIGFSMQLILISFGQAFGVKSTLRIEKRKAALISSTYWIAYCSSKIVFVLFSTLIKEKILVIISSLLLLIGIILSFSLAHNIEICLWSVAFLVGIGFGPLFTVAFASLEKYFRVTGRHTSLIYMTVVAGESIHVPMVGTFIDDCPGIYLYYSGALSAIFLATFIAMPYVCKLLFGDPEEPIADKVSNIPRSSRFGSIIAPVPERRASVMTFAHRDQPERQRSSSVWSKA
ncbi:sodium-dependent glucose transporter 1C-like [Brevipalpus obovatus]|uniref:sodium-dependent glucose transporter 1C-like n=1 Tax=Brevipalpus obovatus TaxID=246614 RepID=UPI003D9E9719